MPPIYNETWEVCVGKEKFRIYGKQVDVLKKAMMEGHRGSIIFGDFAISIPHIQSAKMVSSDRKKPVQIPEEIGSSIMSDKERMRALKKMEEIKSSLIRKKIINY